MKRRRRTGRKSRRKPMKLTQWFKGLSTKKKVILISAAVVVCLFATVIIYVASLFGKIDQQEIKEHEIVVNEGVEEDVGVGYTNFVLFGSDSRSGNVAKNLNTDTIIIVSLNNETKEVRLVSVYRDTLLDMTNGSIQKCNSAYSRGGAKQAINMLNMNLDLDIKTYVTVDFSAVVDLVDMVGGIEVDVSEKERIEANKFINETASVSGKRANFISRSGVQLLDGVQATTYARIRKNVGDDYARTERQRLVIQKVVEKAMKSDLSTINQIVNRLFPRISTNFTLAEILGYAKSFTKYKITETTGFPFVKGSGTIPGRGSSVFPMTLKKNVTMLHEFLYGTTDYQPSAKVGSISAEIASIVGNRKVDPPVETTIGGGEGGTGGGTEGGTGGGTEGGTGGGTEGGTGGGTEGGTGGGTEGGTGGGTEGGTGGGTEGGTGGGTEGGTEGGTGGGTEGGTGGGTEGGTGGGTEGGTGGGTEGGTGGGTEGGTGGGAEGGTGGGTEGGTGEEPTQ